jgi:NAD(P)-dependent dehydrogenase (short-subunit alcohol dehydrogenase family)
MNHWTTTAIPDQAGRTAVITGGDTGLGYQTARALARRGATVVLACRDTAKAARAAEQIGQGTQVVALDLACLASVRDAAAQLRSRIASIDLLINNAGVLTAGESRTEDGFELQFGTNHLGHFALTGLLLDRMTGVVGSRIVTVTSPAYARGHYPPREQFTPMGAYSDSKLANLLFALELQRRLAAAGADTVSLAAHPGFASTALQRHQPALTRIGARAAAALIGQNAADGARPILRAATDPAAHGGEFYGPRRQTRGYPVPVTPKPCALDTKAAAQLWTQSEQDTSVTHNLHR